MKTSIGSCLVAIGLLVLATTGSTSANLIVNGDFETGDFTGWTPIPAAVGSNFGVGPLPPAHDTLGAFFGATDVDFDAISQTFATTPGAFYDLSFFYQVVEPASPPDNGFRVFFDGVVVFENLDAISGFSPFTFSHLQATGSTTTVEFQGRNVAGFDYLDDVLVTGSAGCDQPIISFSENFDGVTPPALPTDWAATQGVNNGGFPFWVTSDAGLPAPPADTLPNSIFTPDPADILDNIIDSPSIAIGPGSAQLTFQQNFDLEQLDADTAFDAAVLEISINGGSFTDIITAGGSFVSGGYNHTAIDATHGNPLLPSRPNWSGVSNNGSGGFQTTVVNLPAAAAGQNIVLRWRMGSDDSVSRDGWRVDSVNISECPPPTGCVRGQGYWKNHPDQWPVTELQLGNNVYDQEQLLSILHQPVRGNGLVLLAHQLIAAKLNIANGADGSCIEQTLADADALIGNLLVPPIGDGHLRPSEVSALADVLDDYNEGGLCASACGHESRTARVRPAAPHARP